MNKTKIEWCDYTLNPVKGLCPMACPYCYARAMYKRFKWDTELRFEYKVFENLNDLKPARIFVGSTMELFGDWIPAVYMKMIFNYVSFYPQHTFIFLTKQPLNLVKWSPFPDNCWIGCSSTGQIGMTADAFAGLNSIEAKVKFISFEPLLSECSLSDYLDVVGTSWVIIGQQTPSSKKTAPKVEWINDIVRACDASHIPVFLKDNLEELLIQDPSAGHFWYQDSWYKLRQDFPQINAEVTK
jgi:protein gp37